MIKVKTRNQQNLKQKSHREESLKPKAGSLKRQTSRKTNKDKGEKTHIIHIKNERRGITVDPAGIKRIIME